MESVKITGRQLRLLVILYVVGSSILFAPATLATEAKQDAWIASLLSIVVGLLVGLMFTKIFHAYPGLSIVHITEEVLGKWVGKILASLFFIFTYLLASLVLRNLGEFMATEILPDTPIQFIHMLILPVVIMGVVYGLNVLAQAAEILSIIFFIMFFFFMIFLIPQIQTDNLLPVFDGGIKPIIRASIPYIGFPFLELVIFLMIFPQVKEEQKVRSAFLIGVAVGGLMISLITLLSILVLGADLTARHNYPSYILGKKISVGNFIERIEAVVAIIWMITIFFKLSILYYASLVSLMQIFQFKSYRFLALPYGVIMIVLALVVYPNIAYIYLFVSRIWFFYAASFGFVFPLILWIGILWRKRYPKQPQNG